MFTHLFLYVFKIVYSFFTKNTSFHGDTKLILEDIKTCDVMYFNCILHYSGVLNALNKCALSVSYNRNNVLVFIMLKIL